MITRSASPDKGIEIDRRGHTLHSAAMSSFAPIASRGAEYRLLQCVVALACLVPIITGSEGILRGAAVFHGLPMPVPTDLDSHFRYLSGIFLVMGLWFASCVPDIAAKSARFRLLGTMVVGGGVARAWSWHQLGAPPRGHQLGLAMELGVVPLLLLWQAGVARRSRLARD